MAMCCMNINVDYMANVLDIIMSFGNINAPWF